MDGVKEFSQGGQALSNEDSEETVLLRRDSHTLRQNRRQSRERTPTALVSRAFDFLNDHHSTVEVFENGSLNIPDLSIVQGDHVDDESNKSLCMRSSAQAEALQDGVTRREYRLKDSGFASLERQLDRETIKTAFSEFTSKSVQAQEPDEALGTTSLSIANTSSDEENTFNKDVKQILEGDVNSSAVINVPKETEKVTDEPNIEKVTDEPNISHILSKPGCGDKENSSNEGDIISSSHVNVPTESESILLSSKSGEQPGKSKSHEASTSGSREAIPSIPKAVQEINERIALAMKTLEGTYDTDEELGDEDDMFENCALEDEDKKDNQPEGESVSEQSLGEQSSSPNQDNYTHISNDQYRETESGNILENLPLATPSNLSIKEHTNVAPENSKIVEQSEEDVRVKDSFQGSNANDIETKSNPMPECSEVMGQSEESHSVSEISQDETKGVEEGNSKLCRRESDTKIIKIERTDQENASSDNSSDEDTGIYAESFRRSNWIRVSKEGKLHLHIPTPPPSSSSTSSPLPPSTDSADAKDNVDGENVDESTSVKPEKDDVFDKPESQSHNWMHTRSDSIASTTSENEFKRKYVSRRKCLIQRADSQQEYHRLSARIYEQDKEVILERNSECQDLGLHLLDSHPAFITSVDPRSPADKAGIVEGQILVSVNDVSVLTTSHEDIIDLIQKCEGSISLGVANSDFQPVRDLQVPIIDGYLYKLGNSSLMRMWKKRYFILRHDNCLYYYKNEQELDPLGALPLGGYTISRHTETNKDYCFKAEKYGARSYYFMSDSRDQMTEWVGAMTQAAARSKKKKESFLSVSSHNVSLPALDIRRPECSGYLYKMLNRSWNKRYCVLKDACIYYYKMVNSLSALGVAHLHGYTIDVVGHPKKKNSFSLHPPDSKMRIFHFSVDNDTDKKRWVESLIHSIQRWVKVDS